MSKGSCRRPTQVTQDEYDNRWDAIFGRDDKPLKVVFAEGCFDDFDGTQEELEDFVAEIHKMAGDGTMFDGAELLSLEETAALKELMAKRGTRQ